MREADSARRLIWTRTAGGGASEQGAGHNKSACPRGTLPRTRREASVHRSRTTGGDGPRPLTSRTPLAIHALAIATQLAVRVASPHPTPSWAPRRHTEQTGPSHRAAGLFAPHQATRKAPSPLSKQSPCRSQRALTQSARTRPRGPDPGGAGNRSSCCPISCPAGLDRVDRPYSTVSAPSRLVALAGGWANKTSRGGLLPSDSLTADAAARLDRRGAAAGAAPPPPPVRVRSSDPSDPCTRQWPEASDFVARFWTLRESNNTCPCENRTTSKKV